MVVGKVTKYLTVSLVSSGLALGLAASVHASGPVEVAHGETTSVTEGDTQSSNSTTVNINEQSSSTSQVSNQTVVQTGSSNTDIVTSSSKAVVSQAGGLNSDSGSGSDKTGLTSVSNHDVALSQNDDEHASSDKVVAGGAGTDGGQGTPVIAEPAVKAQLAVQQTLPLVQTATIRQAEVSTGGLVDSQPVAPSSPAAPAVPAKDLPIQGALDGLNAVLANGLLSVRSLVGGLWAGTTTTPASSLMLLLTVIVLTATVVVGRFVDMLRASGYSHAARADASEALSYLATQLKVSSLLAYVPSYEPAFFGVRNKVFNVPNLYKKGGE